VAADLATARLVTLVGPGGVGKTRLAAQAAASVMDKFPDGVWMFELAGLNSPDGLEASMLATLGQSGTSARHPRQQLLDLVAGWRALLVVDNCEHLLSSLADLVRDLLTAGPELQVLATSREALHLPGEHVTAVEPLPLADAAVTLFFDRAASVRRSLRPEGENQAAVARICQQLDGMPLAIELAAARTSAMSPTEIDRRLDQRFRLLSDRAGGRGRHASLEKAVDWSYDLLAEHEQEFFCRLAVFSGHFDAEAAHSVCGGDDEFATFDQLASLVDKSMVMATALRTRTSYWLLETLRQFGATRLAEDERHQLEDRHGEYFADLCERSWEGLRGRHNADWLELLDDELDNIRAACERVLAHKDVDRAIRITGGLAMYNHVRRLPEIYGWLARALTLPGAYQHRLGHAARLHRENAIGMAGDLSGAEAELRAILEEVDGADPLRPFTLTRLSSVVGTTGRFDEAMSYSLEALNSARDRGPQYDYDQAEATWNLCILAMVQGAPDRARAQQLLEIARTLDSPKNLTRGLMMSGTAHPDPAEGAALLAQARDLAAQIRDSYLHATATAWHSVLTTTDNPRAAIQAIPDLVTHAQSTGQHLIFVYIGRDFMAPLAALARLDAIPILEATSIGLCLRPAAAADAIAAAHEALGEAEYTRLFARENRSLPRTSKTFFSSLSPS
jgi:predicted ATPase